MSDAVSETPPAPRLRPAGPIVAAADLAIWSEASAGLAAAHRHAIETRDWAQAHFEREHARGYQEGRAEGTEAAARCVAETSARASDHLAALERELPALVHGIVADMLGRLDADDLVVRSVRHALDKLRPDAAATLRVPPDQVETIRAALGDLGAHAELRIEADPSLAPGECCLRSAIGSVELGIEAQLRALKAGLSSAADAPR
ncbi:type III secretion system stator protein SctL [Methylobacterium brachythecii]|uniref:Type 3 secretion system stator protein n=1 Tax=Methylobacterium brachythecii TaxID=1176177 RepID=A0A7W6AMF7_9HYPH|nr:type III secretion system stator protein SctL [Methylobacterium brachythecii]MBB3903301.1 type III secretion protein L [Methylobacterium brachythecii]GLS46081.1 nodulation protein [Methylobacterium brachythecii]